MIDYDSFSRFHLTDIFFAIFAGAKELTGRPTFMWKTGDPEMATFKRVRTYRSKHSDTIRFLVNGG